jgi:nucleoid DNA-binding protein
MRKTELALRLAREARVSPAQAADQLDDMVHDILQKLRKGKAVDLPGLGRLQKGRNSAIRFQKANPLRKS